MMTETHPVLVVEDDEMIRETIIEYLDDKGYQAVGAADGLDALEKLRNAKPLPCLIVLDLMMPGMDGVSFRQEQMHDPVLSDIPVVVVSAYKDLTERAKDLEPAACLKKPVKLAELLRYVEEYCPR